MKRVTLSLSPWSIPDQSVRLSLPESSPGCGHPDTDVTGTIPQSSCFIPILKEQYGSTNEFSLKGRWTSPCLFLTPTGFC